MIGANDVTHRMPADPLGAPSVVGGTAAAHGRRGGRGRHLPRPGHDRAGPAAAALAGPPGLPAAGGRPDDRRRRAGRPHGLARATCWAPSSRRTRASCSARTTTTPRRRATRRRRWRCCRRCAPRWACGPRTRSAPTPPAARASCRWPGRPRRRPRRPARRSRPRCRRVRGAVGPAQAPAAAAGPRSRTGPCEPSATAPRQPPVRGRVRQPEAGRRRQSKRLEIAVRVTPPHP